VCVKEAGFDRKPKFREKEVAAGPLFFFSLPFFFPFSPFFFMPLIAMTSAGMEGKIRRVFTHFCVGAFLFPFAVW